MRRPCPCTRITATSAGVPGTKMCPHTRTRCCEFKLLLPFVENPDFFLDLFIYSPWPSSESCPRTCPRRTAGAPAHPARATSWHRPVPPPSPRPSVPDLFPTALTVVARWWLLTLLPHTVVDIFFTVVFTVFKHPHQQVKPLAPPRRAFTVAIPVESRLYPLMWVVFKLFLRFWQGSPHQRLIVAVVVGFARAGDGAPP